MDTVTAASARLSLAFSCVAHSYSHLFAPIFYLVALTLEKDLAMSHGEVVSLIVVGNVLMGVAAPFAGWLGDRWSATGMMVLFFAGTGGALIMTGLATTPFQIGLWLAVTGLFGSIYHPVGIAWLVRNALKRGMALGINGLFGGFGPALATIIAGVLIDFAGWRAAFIVPGVLVVGTGVVFMALLAGGWIVENKSGRHPDVPTARREMVRVYMILAFTTVCTGIIYQATQPALPKLFSERLAEMADGGVMGVSVLVAAVYVVAGAMQVLAGWLADRHPLKTVYLVSYVMQVPMLFLAGSLDGGLLLVVAMVMVSSNVGSLPAENSLITRYTPSRWLGLAFGLKFVLALGLTGLGVKLEGVLYDLTGGFYWLFVVLATIAAVGVAAGLLLPSDRPRSAPVS